MPAPAAIGVAPHRLQPVHAPASIHLVIASRRQDAELVQEALDPFMRRVGMDDEARWRLDLAVREAVANAIVHGNREDPGKPVRIAAEVCDGELVVQIEDEGAGFDPAWLADPRLADRRLAPTGRGVLLMRELVDEARFAASGASGGMTVTLRARLRGSQR